MLRTYLTADHYRLCKHILQTAIITNYDGHWMTTRNAPQGSQEITSLDTYHTADGGPGNDLIVGMSMRM